MLIGLLIRCFLSPATVPGSSQLLLLPVRYADRQTSGYTTAGCGATSQRLPQHDGL